MSDDDLTHLFASAASAGVLSPDGLGLVTGHLGPLVIAGAAGRAVEDLVATDVTLVTILIDASSSIAARGLEQAVRDGHAALVEALAKSREAPSILCALWSFGSTVELIHSYVPVADVARLDAGNYRGTGTTRLYDAWCDALAANVAYAERLRASGTPTRSLAVVITDGEDVGSGRATADCARLSKDLLRSEQFVLAFVGVGSDADFHRVAADMGVPDGSVAVQAKATPDTLRRLFQLVSQSAIRMSQGRITPGPGAGFFAP
jgi:uncharacterized protein YegL